MNPQYQHHRSGWETCGLLFEAICKVIFIISCAVIVMMILAIFFEMSEKVKETNKIVKEIQQKL